MAHRIQLRGETAAALAASNDVLLDREICIETDTMLYKIGNGVTAWNALPYRQLVGEFPNAILMDAVGNPSAPAAGQMMFYAHEIAGKIIPKWIGPSGLDNPVQSEMGANRIAWAMGGTGAVLSVVGMGALTTLGTLTHPAIAVGVNLKQSMWRGLLTSGATANSAAGVRQSAFMCYRGEVFGNQSAGGFYLKTRFGVGTTTALQRLAVGLFSTTAALATTLVPSASTNCILIGNDSADVNLQIMHNDGLGTCTKVDLGVNFPAVNLTATYELALFCRPNGDTVGWRVLRLDTGAVASGVIATDLPVKAQLLTYHAHMNNGGTAAAVVLDFIKMYLETDY